jgi:hypothetical protein
MRRRRGPASPRRGREKTTAKREPRGVGVVEEVAEVSALARIRVRGVQWQIGIGDEMGDPSQVLDHFGERPVASNELDRCFHLGCDDLVEASRAIGVLHVVGGVAVGERADRAAQKRLAVPDEQAREVRRRQRRGLESDRLLGRRFPGGDGSGCEQSERNCQRGTAKELHRGYSS